MHEYGISEYAAGVLADDRNLADYFEAVAGSVRKPEGGFRSTGRGSKDCSSISLGKSSVRWKARRAPGSSVPSWKSSWIWKDRKE